MTHKSLINSRRQFLQQGAGLGSALLLGDRLIAADPQPRKAGHLPRVAAINSIYRHRSHAYHIAGRFIHGYTREGVHHQPPFKLVRMYNDQYPPEDLSRQVCPRHGVELCQTVEQALCGNSGKLDVDAVLLIVEHGDYPVNEYGQIQYPRYPLFQKIVEVFKSSGRSVPVFNDKHLSFDHRLAREMYETSQRMGFGLMAGSSLPVTWRRPEYEPPLGTPFREGLVTFGFGGAPIEIYLFHALESLQCMMERRAGSETGVRRVTALRGNDVWRAADEGRWSWKLLDAALSRSPSRNTGDVKENVTDPVMLLIDYADGARGAVLNLMEQTSDHCFAGVVEGEKEPISTCLYLPPPPGARYFNSLVGNIEKHFAKGKPPYPIERTLLTSTILDLGLHSLHDRTPSESPALAIQYTAPADSGFARGRYTDAG